MFAEVAFPISSFQSFTYRIPRNLTNSIQVGSRVIAILGKRSVQGVIISLNTKSNYKGDMKSISSLVDDNPVLTAELWELILWMSNYYVAPIGQVMKTVMPNRLSMQYSPPKNWYAKLTNALDEIDIEMVTKRAPKQYEILKEIRKTKRVCRITSLKSLSSNPLSI